ncbi:MAG TPA: serine/threonine-protein kinase [Nocardioidaceae bacterium]|nr:serine/threonine-protein kinase [Nocardioidaceae bacterium]
MTGHDSWGLAEGEPITAELTCLRKLGGGSAYEAILAFDHVTYSPVVVKLVRPAQVADRSTLRGLRREVEMLERVRHPAVVRMLRAVTDGERPHLVLEQLDGPRLSSLIRRYGPLEEQQYLPLAIEVASALHYLHGQGIVHLDVKPSNIIMGAPARLIDLSVARTVEQATDLGYVVGTDRYLAPEQAEGRPVPASDVWGLGATLFEAVAGYRAFDDSDEPHPQLTAEAFDLPARVQPDLAKVIQACLDPDPAARPAPAEVADLLGPLLERAPRGRLAGFKVTR